MKTTAMKKILMSLAVYACIMHVAIPEMHAAPYEAVYYTPPGVSDLKIVKKPDGDYLSWRSSGTGVITIEIEIKTAEDAQFQLVEVLYIESNETQYYKLKYHHLDSRYRLRFIDTEGNVGYTPSVLAIALEGDEVMVYPNPTGGQVHIGGARILNYQFQDVRGEVLLAGVPGSNQEVEMLLSSELSRVNSGVYFLKVNTKSGQKMISIRKN
ncbi:hypothetical protein BGP76_12950 [Reichenbachiella sp. MSK19-1]|nr:hypothetical protein BGP76_12950 [Reichenbachiella sp. MSK19-1]